MGIMFPEQREHLKQCNIIWKAQNSNGIFTILRLFPKHLNSCLPPCDMQMTTSGLKMKKHFNQILGVPMVFWVSSQSAHALF
jgi:hypothetical protein